jgi:hypothetical protein
MGAPRFALRPVPSGVRPGTLLAAFEEHGCMLDQHELRELARATGDGLVSIYVPTHRGTRETRGDPIRLKNCIAEAVARAEERGMSRDRATARLRPVAALLDDAPYWQHQDEGLAVFASADGLREHRLPHAVAEEVVVGERFCVRPLLPAVTSGGRFFVLALSRNQVRLVQCTPTGARELDQRDVPASLRDAIGYDFEQRTLQFHGAGAHGARGAHGRTTFHGQGGAPDDGKGELERFLRLVDDGVVRLLGHGGAPLAVAGVAYETAAYRRLSRYGGLVRDDLDGNPDRLGARELRELAWPKVAPVLDAARRDALAAVQAALPGRGAIIDLEQALAAADDKNVATLVVRDGAPIWGRFDAATRRAAVHAQRERGDEDLLDRCVGTALRHGAAVFAVGAAEVPGGGVLAAVRRFVE